MDKALRQVPGLDYFIPNESNSETLSVSASGMDFLSAYIGQYFYNSNEFFFNLFMMSVVGI